ncbi:MAG: hypothetical protein WCS88_02340 [Patescibacteria group bacterium]|jgi:adenine-specific DNA methylase
MDQYISPEEQRLVIEKLYYSTDSITSTNKFNKLYQDKLGKMGDRTLRMYDFASKMKETDFKVYDIERFTKEITGQDIDLDSL